VLATIPADPVVTQSFAENGGKSEDVAPGLQWLKQNIQYWNAASYTCPYPPKSGEWYQLNPELPDGTVISTGANVIGTPRVSATSTQVRFVWWETGIAVGYGSTLAEAQANAAADRP
jgi:hypothetical protein